MVSPLPTASLSFQTPAPQTGKIPKALGATDQPTEGTAFSMLFSSLSAAVDLPAAGESADNPLGELADLLKEAVAALEEFTSEARETEEEMIGTAEALLQALSLLLKKAEGLPVAKELPQPLVHGFTEQLQALALLEENTKTGKTSSTDPLFPLIDAEDAEQLLKQLAALVQQDDARKQTTGGQQLVQKLEELEQVLKQWVAAEKAADGQKQAAPSPDALPANRQASEVFRQLPGTPMEVDIPQPLPASAPDTVKAEALTGRSEPAPPTPTVRMANLTEELGEVLKGSFRLTGTGENTQQIRVNIAPDHLGHLDIRLTLINGKMAAQIFTSSFAAKEMLELQVNQLRASLLQQGVAIDKIEITQHNPQQSFSQQHASPEQRFAQQQKPGSQSFRNGYRQFEEEAAAAVIIEPSAGSKMKVDYTI
ncbi:flagellar hook-length control protein FliK [Planococcus salinus]|uniref:Flagellar hook-length control protein FliK n=1 Tax=Planococcus salinus TaxID=1848460 RepID=A0A3M8P561_9BACL|nr:flagellar hook-length control protein FliK [Planococcus salinus]RNF38752.1 flagellar hook-length control protein FliK [Planococcus salinus]